MDIKKFSIIFIVMSIVAYIVYAASPNPGHIAIEVGGDGAIEEDRTFMNYPYSFPHSLAVGKTKPEHATLDVKGIGEVAILGYSDDYIGVFGKSDTAVGVQASGLTHGVFSQGEECDFMAADSIKYCFIGGSYLTVSSSGGCDTGEEPVASSNGKTLCFKG